MITKVIIALNQKGWSNLDISKETGICVEIIKRGVLTDKQEDAILRLAAVEAKLDIDEILEG